MSKIENLVKQIERLSAVELAEFRRWYSEFDAQAWNEQFAADVKAGKLDALAEKALKDHSTGRSDTL